MITKAAKSPFYGVTPILNTDPLADAISVWSERLTTRARIASKFASIANIA